MGGGDRTPKARNGVVIVMMLHPAKQPPKVAVLSKSHPGLLRVGTTILGIEPNLLTFGEATE